MKRENLAAQLYTVRDEMKTPGDIEKGLRRVRDIGYRSVQVSGLGPIEPERLGELLQRFGLKLWATHTPWQRILEQPDAVIAEHKLLDCPCVGLGCLPAEYRQKKAEGYLEFARQFSAAAEIYGRAGLKLLYHNHNFEFEKFDGITGMERIAESLPLGSAGLTADLYWIHAGGMNVEEFLAENGAKIAGIHLKDMEILDGKQEFSEVGRGNFNWDRLLEACRKTDAFWYAVEQDVCRRDPFESLEISFRFLERYL